MKPQVIRKKKFYTDMTDKRREFGRKETIVKTLSFQTCLRDIIYQVTLINLIRNFICFFEETRQAHP